LQFAVCKPSVTQSLVNHFQTMTRSRRDSATLAGWTPFALAAVPLLFLTVVLVAPALRLLWEGGAGFKLSSLSALWQDHYLRWRWVWSLLQACVTCALVLLLGLPVAWVLARFDFVGRALVLRLLMLPFVMPTLVAALGVLSMWGPQGVANAWWGMDAQDTPWLLLYGNVFFNLCLLVRAGVDGLAQVSASQLAAASTLGASPWRTFWRVEWPVAKPWLGSALCLVFLYCFSGFGLALVLGGQRYATLEVEIYTLVAYELKLAEASVLALFTMAITASAALAYTLRAQRLAAPAQADAVAFKRVHTLAQRSMLAAALLVLLLCCVAPVLAIIARAVASGPSAWAVLIESDTLHALWNTLRFSATAVVLALLLGVAHALAAQRSNLLRVAMFLPFIVSPVAVAFGLLLLYPAQSASLSLLVAAYALLAYPFIANAVSTALASQPAHLVQAARTLGASPWRSFWRVTLPLLRPALRRGVAFAAASALGEFAVSLFLSRPEWTTLTTLIYQRLGKPGAANLDAAWVLACLLMALALLAFALLEHSPIETPSSTLSTEARRA
jgi:thiamine transport system permease protein